MSLIFAVITTFRPTQCLPINVAKIAEQVDGVIIVDDGDSNDNKKKLGEWFSGESKVTIISQPENLGIAAALNTGMRKAIELGAEWVITLDDDSTPVEDLVPALMAQWADCAQSYRVGIIAAKWGAGQPDRNENLSSAKPVAVKTLITSGCLMKTSIYKETKGFREEFFIDSVDFDMCLQLKEKGYSAIEIQTTGILHTLGTETTKRLPGLTIHSTNHAPFRRYYAMRNSLTLMKEQLFQDPLFAIKGCVWWIITILKILIVEKNRRKKLKAMWAGAKDFLKGKYGKIDSKLAKAISTTEL